MVVFGSYNVPNFEEEFDPAYYGNLQNIPGSGDYGTYVDYDGNEVTIGSLGIVPYFMWNATGEMYTNVLYGANFKDYVGHVDQKITMVKPVNGVSYDSFICDQYFDLRIDGPAAPDETAVAAIKAIKAIPERVSADDKALVENARQAYDKIATLEQQALVTNYSDLVSAEQRIKALTTDDEDKDNDSEKNKDSKKNPLAIVIIIVVAVLVALAGVFVFLYIVYKEKVLAVLASIKNKLSSLYKKVCKKSKKEDKSAEDVAEKTAEVQSENTEADEENGDNNETEN